MTDVWRGDILLPDGRPVRDVGFTSQHGASSPGMPAAALRFLATVDTAKVPLWLAAGPSYDVWTGSDASEAWFESVLLSQPAPSTAAAASASHGTTTHEWWTWARAQSPIGILVQAEHPREGAQKPRVTEILLYATVAAPPAVRGLPAPAVRGLPAPAVRGLPAPAVRGLPAPAVRGLPAPALQGLSTPALQGLPAPALQGLPAPALQGLPAPALQGLQPALLPELRVHALPLSADLLPASIPPLPSPTLSAAGPPDEIEARFLPTQPAPSSPKRKRDLFEEATAAKRKARGNGGESVAAAAARAAEAQRPYPHRKSISLDARASPLPDSRPPSRQLSRSPSITSDIRPRSRKGKEAADTQGRRSNLSRVDTISLQPEPAEPTTESRNKEALTKVVMAAMRMHGLQQRRKTKSRRPSMAPAPDESQPSADEVTAEDVDKDEEFKLIYHQTYKGAALALRKHITEKPLHAQPDRMRDLVEQFLTLFLTDPLAQPLPSHEPTNPVATPGIKQVGIFGSSHHHASPFDLPSGMRRPPMMRSQTDSHVYTGSPVSKRKTMDRKLDQA